MRAFALWVLALVVGALFTNELLGLLSSLSRFLVECAVRRLPESMQHDRREEWLANLEYEGQDGRKLSELTAALEALWGASKTARALEPSLPIEEQVELIQKRGTNRFLISFIFFISSDLVLRAAERNRPDLYAATWWAWPLFGLAALVIVVSVLECRKCYRRAEELEQKDNETIS